MVLDAAFTMSDNISRPVTDPFGFHDTNEQFTGVDFSFSPVTHGSVERKEALGFSTFSEPTTSGTTNVHQSNPTEVIDSDDDFGDFTSVAPDTVNAMDASLSADPFGFPASTASEPAMGTSFEIFGFRTSSSHSHASPTQEDLRGHIPATLEMPSDKARSESTAFPGRAFENNSDDDWGDFVDNSTSASWENSPEFDWFNTSQQNEAQRLPSESVTSYADDLGVAWESGVWTGPAKVEVPKAEQKATNFTFNDLSFFAGADISSADGSKALLQEANGAKVSSFAKDEMPEQPKMSGLQRTLSGQKMGKGALSSAPIPLSLFGENELEFENSNTDLPDPVEKSFQGHSRSKARSTGYFSSDGTSLSDLIATLYTESQPDVRSKNPPVMDSVDLNKNNDSVDNDNSDKDLFDAVIGNNGNRSLEERMFSLRLSLELAADLGSFKGNIAMPEGSEFQSQGATSFVLLDSASTADRCTFVKAWASILAVCASELELGLNIWKQAQNEDVHLDLLADPQGKKYFVAIGQVYVVALILAATVNFYKPWLSLASKEAESLQADLERCKAAWLKTNLKEGVHLALDGLQGLVPSTVVSWEGIEGFAAVALDAYLQAPKASVHSICGLSLLPLASFNCTGLPPVEWSGSSYLLPLANMWVNCVSHKPPSTILITQLKTL